MTEKKLYQFGHNVREYRLVSTVTARFRNSTGQTTKMSQRKKKQARVSDKPQNVDVCSLLHVQDLDKEEWYFLGTK